MDESLDCWREYFRGANSDIFDIIEHAVIVAALDCPKDFKSRRDHIAELLFTCKTTKCFGCDKVELSVPRKDIYDEEDEGAKCKNGGFEGPVLSKESKVNSSVEMEMNVNQVSNVGYGDAEALTDEIEKESQFIGEVLTIKEIFDNHQEESDTVLYESLRRLQLMDLSVEILKVTEIGKSVNGLRKHGSKQIRELVRTLIDGWVGILDAWMNATAAIAENTSPESVKTSAVVEEDDEDEEGLPSPPLDEGAFLSHSIELSQIFDGVDDDRNPRKSGEFNQNRVTCRKPSVQDKGSDEDPHNLQKSIVRGKQRLTNNQGKDNKSEQPTNKLAIKKSLPGVKPSKSSSINSGSGRPPKPTTEQKINNAMKFQQGLEKLRMQKMPLADPQHISNRSREQQRDKGAMEKRPLAPPQEKLRSPDNLQLKMEATKRKLQERYQEAENAKRQRTVQVMDLSDIPKQDISQNQQMKPGAHNRNRNWTNGRR